MEFLKDYINEPGSIHTTTQQMPQIIKQHPEKKDCFVIEKQVNIWHEYPKTKPNLSEYPKTNKPVAVLGSGPALPKDLEQLPEGCLLISCNHHAFKLIKPDIICFLDPVEQRRGSEYYRIINNPGCIRISLNELNYTDYYTIDEFPEELKPPADSGRFSLWVASYISTGDIYLCGIGLRQQGEPEHFYDDERELYSCWGGPTLEVKINQWMKYIDYVGRNRVKVVSGPLKYDTDG